MSQFGTHGATCEEGAQLIQTQLSGAYPVGNTAFDGVNPIEMGQSLTAPCDGTLTSVQVAILGATGESPESEVDLILTVYEGEGTSGTLLSTTPITITTPSSSSPELYDLDISGEAEVTEGEIYSFFIDIVSPIDIAMLVAEADVYDGGFVLITLTGNAAGSSYIESFDLLFVATFGAPVATSVEKPGEQSLSLSPAYPNPTREIGQMDLTVVTPQHVTVEAYDLLGHPVATLFDGTASPYEPVSLTLDATDLAPGAYVVHAVGESFATTRRITVMR